MNETQMLGIVERYIRKSNAEPEEIKVTQIADRKTIFVEQTAGESSGGRAIMLTAYKVDGATYWAGYSFRSQTVYVSMAA
jgi:hypothetical protein